MFLIGDKVLNIFTKNIYSIIGVNFDKIKDEFTINIKDDINTHTCSIVIKLSDLFNKNSTFHLSWLHLSECSSDNLLNSVIIETVIYNNYFKETYIYKSFNQSFDTFICVTDGTNNEVYMDRMTLNVLINEDVFFVINRKGSEDILLPSTVKVYNSSTDTDYYINLAKNQQLLLDDQLQIEEKNLRCPSCGSKYIGFGPSLCDICKNCGHFWS